MRVLLISHNSLSKSNNMGRTLENQFHNFNSDEIAQLYFTKGTPESEHCKDFFCIPDTEVFKSVYTRKPAGFSIELTEKITICDKQSKDVQLETAIRKKGNRRPCIYLARNMIWALGKWKTKELDLWLDKINPDVIFFASGDYSFSYIVTMHIARKRNIPVIIGCYDDFYLGKKKTLNPLYHLIYKNLMRNVRKTFDYAHSFMALSEMMTDEYSALFNKLGNTMYVPTEINTNSVKTKRKTRIFYAGNLGHGRAEQLVLLGKSVKSLGRSDITHIDVYSSEIRKELTSLMSEDNGIVFHGRVSPEYVQDLMRDSKYVIHTESFDDEYKKRVKYSVSTKIADCLSCGACIVAFGPKDVASIDYLDRAKAAWVISDVSELAEKLIELFDNDEKSNEVICNAVTLSKRNHSNEQSSKKFKDIIFGSMA